MKKELGANVMVAPEFNVPNIKDYEFGTDWQNDLLKEIKKMLDSPEGKIYKEKLKQFTENLHANSTQIEIPKLPMPSDEETCNKNENSFKELAKQILQKFSEGKKSRILLISNGRDEKFYDAHSTIILGPTKNGDDLLVLEKEELGSGVEIKKLSKVISSYSYGWRFKNPEFNICDKPADELYPITN